MDRDARKNGIKECDVAGADLPREVTYDIERGVGVAIQAYTKIIDVVNPCLEVARA